MFKDSKLNIVLLFAGVGGTLAYAPPIVLVNKYFNERRGIATGIATAGSGLGAFAYPPVVSLLFSYYGYFGALLVISAVSLNLCVAASLYRPIDLQLSKHNTKCTDFQIDLEIATAHEDSQSLEDNAIEKDLSTKSHLENSNCTRCLKNKYIDLSLLGDPVFLVFGIAQGILTMSYVGGQLLLLALAENVGVAESKGVFLLSAVGIADTVGRISSGFIFDCYAVRRHRITVYSAYIFLTSLTYFGWAFGQTFELLITICVLHGYINGAVVSQRAVIASDILGVERLSSSFGLTVCIQGCGNLIGPFITGKSS